MLDVAILGQVAFGYSPFIDRSRAVSATRLTVFPLRSELARAMGRNTLEPEIVGKTAVRGFYVGNLLGDTG